MPRQKQVCPRRCLSPDSNDETTHPTNGNGSSSPPETPETPSSAYTPDAAAGTSSDCAPLDLSLPRRQRAESTASITTTVKQSTNTPDKPKPTSNGKSAISDGKSAISDGKSTISELSRLVHDIKGKTKHDGSLRQLLNLPSYPLESLWSKFPPAPVMKNSNENPAADLIFTCLQCKQAFGSMRALTQHMQVTRHYQHFSEPSKTAGTSHSPLPPTLNRSSSTKSRAKYSEQVIYYCFLCSGTFSDSIESHFKSKHDMHDLLQCMMYVQLLRAEPSSLKCSMQTKEVDEPLRKLARLAKR